MAGAREKILIVLHQENSTPGRVGHVLKERGYTLDIRRPRFGDPLPDSMEEHAAAVIFGGPMSANDPDDFVKREIDWTEVPMRDGAPFLGICLGAQMLAKQLGARVDFHDKGHAEIGYYPLTPTEAGKSLLDWPERVYQWHREGFDAPAGTTLLAEGQDFAHQAFRAGDTAFAIQFHPEVTTLMMNRWTVLAAHRLELPGAQARREHFEGRRLYDRGVAAWLNAFLDLWLGTDRRKDRDPVKAAAE